MHVGNARYLGPKDLPEILPVFPLTGALLLPGAQLPLNIFEPRYLAMFDDALAGNRLIGIVQPSFAEGRNDIDASSVPALCQVGCIGRITSFAETGDGRYITSLTGVCRFRLFAEVAGCRGYRRFRIGPFGSDLESPDDESLVDGRRSSQPSGPISTPTSSKPTGKAWNAPAIVPSSTPWQ